MCRYILDVVDSEVCRYVEQRIGVRVRWVPATYLGFNSSLAESVSVVDHVKV